MKKFVGAAIISVIGFSVAMAEDFRGTIKKVDGDKITVLKRGKMKGEKGEEVTLTVTSNAKITQGTFNRDTKKVEAGNAIENGLKNEMFSKGEVNASFVTNDAGAVTEIIVF